MVREAFNSNHIGSIMSKPSPVWTSEGYGLAVWIVFIRGRFIDDALIKDRSDEEQTGNSTDLHDDHPSHREHV